jgi:hypothetical protein
LRFLEGDPDREQLHSRYGELLDAIPEEKALPQCVTRLKTHLDLVGKVYRVLRRYVDVDFATRGLRYNNVPAKDVSTAEASWEFRLMRCKVTFEQRPSRAHDLGVFLKLHDVMQRVGQEDHALLHTLDALWLLLPGEDVLALRTVLSPLLDAGFTVEAEVAEVPLATLSSDVFEKRKDLVRKLCLQPQLAPSLPPKLCELCQVQRASLQPVIDERSGIQEFLCDTCKGYRDLSKNRGTFRKLGDLWEELDISVAWVRIHIDYVHLHRTLRGLYRAYLDQLPPKVDISGEEIDTIVNELRDTALMVDFTRDFEALVSRYTGRLKKELDPDDIENIAGERPELLVVALVRRGQVLDMADIFLKEFEQVFPACEGDSPVSLSMSISNAKYPFFEHWRYLDQPKEAINIQVVGRACLELSIPRYRRLREMAPERASSKLHRAAAVGVRTRSALMEKIEFLENLGRYPNLQRAHIEERFAVGQLLDYHKILELGGIQ